MRATNRGVLRLSVMLAAAVLVGLLASCRPIQPPADSPANVERYRPWYAERILNRTYQTFFGRLPDDSENNYWFWKLVGDPEWDWFVDTMMGTGTYAATLGGADDAGFVDAGFRNTTGSPPSAEELAQWTTDLGTGDASRRDLLLWLTQNGYGTALVPPDQPVIECTQYDRGGLVPSCEAGSDGHQRHVVILHVPRTNIYVNERWYPGVAALVARARSEGYDLQAYRDPGVPSWMFSPGSWRSYDEQQWLRDAGYPANPAGRSLHEWGLALDLSCNGRSIQRDRGCWDWLRAVGPGYGIYNFNNVSDPSQSEAWHFSSNGR